MFQTLLTFLTTVFLTGWQSHWTNIQNLFSAFTTSISNLVDSIKQIFQGIIDFVAGVFTADWERAWQGVQDVFAGIFNALVEIVKVPLNGIISMLNKAIGFINSLIAGINEMIAVLNMLGAGLPMIPTIPEIPLLAKGGIWRPAAPLWARQGRSCCPW